MLLTIGELGAQIGRAARNAGLDDVHHIEQSGGTTGALAALESTVAAGDAVLVKGSRALGLDTLVAAWLAARGVADDRAEEARS